MKARAAALLLALGGPAAAEPMRLTDALGRQVALPAPPQRLVTIFASNTELAAAVGLAGRIVGIESFTRFPPEVVGRPQVGGRLGFSVDRVARLQPDLVIVTPARQAVHQLVDPMERLGIPIMVVTHRSVAEVMDNIRLVARAGGVAENGESVVAGLEGRLQAVARRVEGRARPRAVMITGRVASGLLIIARPGSYTADAMVRAGLSLAFDQPQVLAQVSPEAILRADPDIVLFAGTEAAMADLFQRPGWRHLRALREGKVLAVSRAEFLIPGPRVVTGIETLAARVHDEARP